MRIRRVHAEAFGPFADKVLELAPGMTVVCGGNEAGKSSWHAALYAGLCGRRRARGQPRREDREFARRHRPWDGPDWKVAVVVELADGRTVELRHDLDGLVDCRATDLALGRDISADLVHDGSPDGALLLGLTRQTLPPTVFVRQSDLLGVLADPGALQEALQRAAATSGADDTAERALATIAAFRREHLGREDRRSRRGLMEAARRVEAAEAELESARGGHEEYLKLCRARDDAGQRTQQATVELQRARLAVESRRLERQRARLAEARDVAAAFPDGPPAPPDADEAVATTVAQALAAWDARPEPPPALGPPTAAELAAELAGLPAAPEGDTAVDAAVAAAHRRWQRAWHAVDADRDGGPAGDGVDGLPDTASAAQLREAADALEATVAEPDPRLRAEVEAARASSARPARVPLLTAAGVAGGAALVLLLAGLTGPGLAVLVGAAALAGVAARSRPPMAAALEARLAVQEAACEQARDRREAARRRADDWGLPADAGHLRELARALDDRDADARRTEQARRRRADLDAAARDLAGLLDDRGVATAADADLDAAFDRYVAACHERAGQARRAARREALQAQLEARVRLEEAAEADRGRRARAGAGLRAAAAAADLTAGGAAAGSPVADEPVGSPAEPGPDGMLERLAEHLRRWQRDAAARRQAALRARDDWQRLQALLDGGCLDDLAAAVERQEELVAALPGLEPLPLPPQAADEAIERWLDELRAAERDAREELAGLAAQVADRGAALVSVAEAEEKLERASAERERLRRLDRTLSITSDLLEAARDRVHRDIAPRLKEAVQRRLPAVTGGRYDEVAVDPASLQVRVRAAGGPWREATALSHGTAEQVYLLLRVALAEHLVTTGEPAPLVLDDPTVQSDHTRTRRLLDLLHDLSDERQVIVFSQEDQVRSWAEQRLAPPGDRLVLLDGSRIPA